MEAEKYYIVWVGKTPGIYTTWEECKAQVQGFPKAKYKSYKGINREEAERLLEEGEEERVMSKAPKRTLSREGVIPDAIAVDASTRKNPGPMEYRGVVVETGDQLFSSRLYPVGTNNIGEFLAIVHAMAWMKQQNYFVPIYSDSRNAIQWVRKGVCKTKLVRSSETEELFRHVERAIAWLRNNDTSKYQLLKWETKLWGEIPADYGRK